MIIDDVRTYLIAESESFSAATVKKAFMPDDPDDLVCLYDTGGAEPSRDIPTGDPTFQVVIRNESYESAHSLVQEIVTLLHQKRNVQLVDGGTYFYYIYLIGEPGAIGRDAKGRDEFSVNFLCKIRR